MAMMPEGNWAKEHRVTDILMLLGIVFLALTTWSCVSASTGIPLWKSYISILAALFLALAALTRHPNWAASIRLITGGWIIAAPYLLGFADITPAPRIYLTIGAVIAASSIPGITGSWTIA
jgi:hypothetical protein